MKPYVALRRARIKTHAATDVHNHWEITPAFCLPFLFAWHKANIEGNASGGKSYIFILLEVCTLKLSTKSYSLGLTAISGKFKHMLANCGIVFTPCPVNNDHKLIF